MKRLRKLAFGQTLYHGTSYDTFLSIYETGSIVPQLEGGAGIGIDEPNEEDYYDTETEEYNYEEYEEALDAYQKQEQGFHGYSFLAGSIQTAKNYSSSGDIGIVLEVDVSEDALLPDDNDCPDCKTWQESLQKVDQVKVVGEVTSDYIRRIHFFDNKTKKKLFISTWDSWQEDMEKNQSKVSGEEEYQFDPNVDEEAGVFFKKAQEAGLNVQNDVIVNPPINTVIDIYENLKETKGKQEDLRGFISNDGNIYVTFHSIRDVTSEPANFVYLKYSGYQFILYTKLNDLSNVYTNNPSLEQNLKNVFEDKKLSINTNAYTVDELIEKIQPKQEVQTANMKRLLRKIAK